MGRFLLTLGLAGACATGLFATGASAAIADGPLAARAAVTDTQGVEQAAWVCRGGPWFHRCHRVWGGPFAFAGPRWGWGHRWHRWHRWGRW